MYIRDFVLRSHWAGASIILQQQQQQSDWLCCLEPAVSLHWSWASACWLEAWHYFISSYNAITVPVLDIAKQRCQQSWLMRCKFLSLHPAVLAQASRLLLTVSDPSFDSNSSKDSKSKLKLAISCRSWSPWPHSICSAHIICSTQCPLFRLTCFYPDSI